MINPSRTMSQFLRNLRYFLRGKPIESEEGNEAALISQIREDRLSYCGPPKLENLANAVKIIRNEKIEGDFLEAGVALGGSAILLGLLKPANAQLRLYDVFGMIPPPTENDGDDAHARYSEIKSGESKGLGGDIYYGYVDDLLTQVQENFRRRGLDPERSDIHFVQGLFEDSLHPPQPVALAHVDCDWYDPVWVCINRILPKLVPGGIIVFDDYSSYSGCRRAVDELLAKNSELEKIFEQRSIGLRKKRLSIPS